VADCFVLVHAPVLGPGSWAPVAGELTRRGRRVVVPSLAGFAEGGPPYTPRLVARARARVPDIGPDRAVLVVHSGAGTFAPYLADAIKARDVAVLFADASLPARSGPAPVSATVVDGEFLPFLRGIAADGLVPPWPRWWPAEELSPLFPDERTRQAVSAEAEPLPLAFFEERLPPVPPTWDARSCGYLRFSEGYLEPAREAADRGWPVRDLPGEHLHLLVDPPGVAAALAALTATI
jgi:hypothetical protein